MLGTLRKGAHSFFAKILMGLLIASFALWGIGDMIRSGGQTASIATVGEQEISVQEFESQIQRMHRNFGDTLTPELIRNLNLYSIKLQEMINRSLIEQEAQRLGISISDEALVKEISKDPAFANPSGAFDKPLFLKTLRQSGISEKEYMESVRTELAVRILLSTFSNYSLVPSELARTMYAAQYEERTAQIIQLRQAPSGPITPADEALQKYYESHQSRYTAPEYRTFSYITLKPDDIYKKIDISRQELFDFYTQRAASYVIPQKRGVRQLLYTAKDEADKAYSMLQKGKSLDDVAKNTSAKGGTPTALGEKTQEEMPAGGKEIFSLDAGEFTVPIQSPFGWHIFELEKIIPESTAPFDTVKEELKAEIISQRATTVLGETIEQLEDELSAGRTLKEAAHTMGISYLNTDPVDRFGQRGDTSAAFDAKADEELLRTAFSLQPGERSEMLTLPDGSYYMVELDTITPPRERAFEEVRGQVAADVTAIQQRDALKDYAQKAASMLATRPQEEFAQALESIKGARQFTLRLTRNGASPNTPLSKEEDAVVTPALLSKIFALEAPGKVSEAVATPEGYAIAVLEKIYAAPSIKHSEKSTKPYKALKRALREDYHNELLDQYLRHLRSRYPVSMNEEAIKALMNRQ